jgi:Putative peptidoglycan binding domain
VLTGAAVLAVVTVGAVVTTGAKRPASATPLPPASTATIKMGELSATVSVNGTLTYLAQSDGSPYLVINQSHGVYTELPAAGQVISQGQALYRVNDSPVVLLYGSTPAYRTLSAGDNGPDVAELNADLVQLGYATSGQLSLTSAVFGTSTTTALEKLQRALGVTQNGTLVLGQAVFEPSAMRVMTLSAPLGSAAQANQTVMQATSTTRQVQVALDASQQINVAVGDKVTITLPNNRITPGVVSSVGTVASCPSGQGSGGANSSSVAPGTDACASGNSTPTIPVGITPSDPVTTGTWDQAPVQVGITTATVPSALAVPVTALLAQSGGGYSVEVVGPGGSNHLVAVSLGLFDDAAGLVQVTSPRLAAGQEVVVANA